MCGPGCCRREVIAVSCDEEIDTLIHSPGCGEGGVARRTADDYDSKQESADDSSKQNNGKRGRLSLPPSLLLQGDMGMEEPHSLLAMYVSAEKQTSDHDWY